MSWLATTPVIAAAPVARVVVAWPAGPLEARVAFDRPIDPALARAMIGTTITFDENQRTVPRSGTLPAGARSTTAPRGSLKIAGARLDDDGRTLVLATDPHPRETVYTLMLPGFPTAVRYDLTGVEAIWDSGQEDAPPIWSGWWPHLEPDETRRLAVGSVEQQKALKLLEQPGRLTLRALIVVPRGPTTLRIVSTGSIEQAMLGGENGEIGENRQRATFTFESTGDAIDLELAIRHAAGGQPLTLHATFGSKSGAKEQAVSRDRLLVPWAPATPPSPPPPPTPPELAGGDRARGEAIFYGDQAKCAHCHKVGAKGGIVGPDLTEVHRRPLAEVYREIADPSALIHPDFVPYTVALKDGRIFVGIVRADGAGSIRVTDTDAKATVVPKAEIEAFRPVGTSIMPVGLVGAIGEAAVRDLMAFLMAGPVRPKP